MVRIHHERPGVAKAAPVSRLTQRLAQSGIGVSAPTRRRSAPRLSPAPLSSAADHSRHMGKKKDRSAPLASPRPLSSALPVYQGRAFSRLGAPSVAGDVKVSRVCAWSP